MKELLSVDNVNFSYDGVKEVLKGINLKIYEGDFIALIGTNGCGKTTLSKTFNGILKPDSGTVTVMGNNTAKLDVSKLASFVGYCYQNPDHQIFNSTIKEEIEFGPRNIGMTEEQISKKVDQVMNLVNLKQSLDEYPFSLSKGERQKLAVASILAMEAPIIVIDEPTTGLDYLGSLTMMNIMKELNDKGHTLVIITHDMRFVVNYAKRVIAMDSGEIIADTTPLELLKMKDALIKTNLRKPQIYSFMEKLNLPGKKEVIHVRDAIDIISNQVKSKNKGGIEYEHEFPNVRGE